MAVPPIIDAAEFEALQTPLKTRSPALSAPRIVSGPTFLTGFCFCATCGGAMTLRTGKSGRYKYYTCSTKARQGETGCKGRTVPMAKLDHVVAEHIEHRLLQPKRREHILSRVLDRREERARRRTALDRLGPGITPQALKTFASQARRRMRTESGGYRREHLRALAQRVEVDAKAVRIMGSKSVLLRTLVAAESAKTAGFGVPGSVPKWRPRSRVSSVCMMRRAAAGFIVTQLSAGGANTCDAWAREDWQFHVVA
jgi:hypothetical protein